jgi:hypothetical protein
MCAPNIVLSASYDTLPKGVNTVVFKQVMTSKIESKYLADGNQGSLDLKEEFTSSRLTDISTVIDSYFKELKELSPEAYNTFSLGEFSADISAEVSAQGFGLGYGLTDRLTIYAAVPYYHIKTNVAFTQSKASNLSQIQGILLNTNPSTAMGKFVQDLTLQLPTTNAELLQSIVVNHYGYQPIGKWESDSLGDTELGFIYRLTDFNDRGLALSMGVVLPTGQEDDPNSLQDVSTGDGQYDTFVEAMAGMSFLDKTFEFDFKGRYTYQASSDKEVRAIEDVDVPLSQKTIVADQKLGDKIDLSATLTYNPSYWIYANTSYLFTLVDQTRYENIQNAKIRNALESNTESSSHWIKVGLGINTTQAYKAKKFDIPLDISVNAQKLLNAKNTVSYDRIDIDFKFYF